MKKTLDTRCPRQLEEAPTSFCPLAVTRLRALRTAGRELTEEEESALPGCPWSINSQSASYCFFKYMEEFNNDSSLSDVEVASLNCLSVETVKKIEKEALNKIRNTEQFKQLREDLNGENAFETLDSGEGDYSISH